MADLKPSTAPGASALDGTELIPCTQGGASKALTPAQLGAYSAASGSDLIIGTPSGGVTALSSAGGNKMQLAFRLTPLNGTASAPGLTFDHGSGVNSGAWYDSSNGALIFEINGENRLSIEHGSYRLRMSSSGEIAWSATTSATNNPPDTGLRRLAAGVLWVSDGQGGKGWLQWAGESYVAADATNATTTLAATGLSLNVTSGRSYAFKCILYVSDSVAAEGVKIDFGGGTATATNFRAHVTGFDSALTVNTQLTTLTGTASAGTFSGAGMIEIHGSFEPASTGTFVPRFAQNSHAIGTLTLFRGSHLLMWDAT